MSQTMLLFMPMQLKDAEAYWPSDPSSKLMRVYPPEYAPKTIGPLLEASDKAGMVKANYRCTVKSQNVFDIWQLPVSGILIDPYPFINERLIPLPDGTLIDFKSLKVAKEQRLRKFGRWFAYLGEDYRHFTTWDDVLVWSHLFKVFSACLALNKEVRQGNVGLPELPTLPPIGGRDKAVAAKHLQNIQAQKELWLPKRNKAIAKLPAGECPYGEDCSYAKQGILCFHNPENSKIAQYFKTRDLTLIEEAMSLILQTEATRYEQGRALEEKLGTLSPAVTDIGDKLFKKVQDFLPIIKPSLSDGTTFNILNQQVNVSVAVDKLESAGMTHDQRTDLAREIAELIKDEKLKRTAGTAVAA